MTPRAFTAQCVAICRRGFDNEHAWMAWLKARKVQIDKLPQPLRARVYLEHTNSGPKDLK